LIRLEGSGGALLSIDPSTSPARVTCD